MTTAASASPPKQRRQLRNLLLDSRFQLKYAGYLVSITLIVGATLGFFLWITSDSLLQESRRAVEQGQKVVALSQRVTKESAKVRDMVKMNIVKAYGNDPVLRQTYEAAAKKDDKLVQQQQRALEEQTSALVKQSEVIARQQRTMMVALLLALALLVLAVGLAGIVVTHKIAGPIHKMTRQLRRVGKGELSVPEPLRAGDELSTFFAAFGDMVGKLRSEREEHIALLDQALEEDADTDRVTYLEQLRQRLASSLDKPTA